jgi:SAM-dependent methyltransferase
VCGDARHLPFKARTFHAGFSYSVIQHFAEADAERAIAELGRVLVDGGIARVQMAHVGGLRSTYVRTRPDYLDSGPFRVRYWSLSALRETFTRSIGPAAIAAEAFGGLGLLPEDWRVVNGKSKILIAASVALKAAAGVLPPLTHIADSVYVTARKS